jgi:hypothetical protein
MVSMSDELKERNLLKLILIVRFVCATFDVGHPIFYNCRSGIQDSLKGTGGSHSILSVSRCLHLR